MKNGMKKLCEYCGGKGKKMFVLPSPGKKLPEGFKPYHVTCYHCDGTGIEHSNKNPALRAVC